jgi:hypothetical protein
VPAILKEGLLIWFAAGKDGDGVIYFLEVEEEQ